MNTIWIGSQEIPLLDSVLNQIKRDLSILLTARDVNYIYIIKKRQGPQTANQHYGLPIIVGLTSQHTRNDLLAKARTIEKQKLKSDNLTPRVYYNERLSKQTQEIFFQARSLVKKQCILSAWSYKGEVYIRRDKSTEPHRIVSLTDLSVYT